MCQLHDDELMMMMMMIWRRAEEAPKAKGKITKCERVKKGKGGAGWSNPFALLRLSMPFIREPIQQPHPLIGLLQRIDQATLTDQCLPFATLSAPGLHVFEDAFSCSIGGLSPVSPPFTPQPRRLAIWSRNAYVIKA